MISNDRETELELIRLAQAGDQRAFRQLIQEAHSRMWAVCLSTTGNRHDAEDALQNALTSIWRNIGKFEPRASSSAEPSKPSARNSKRPSSCGNTLE